MASASATEFCPALRPGFEVKLVAEGAVIEEIGMDKVHFVNATAARILSLCDGETSVSQIAAILQAEFKLPDSPVATVSHAVQQFRDSGLVD